MDLDKVANVLVTQAVMMHDDNQYSFASSVFKDNHELLPESDIEFCPMSAFSGPLFALPKIDQFTFESPSGMTTVEMRRNPDVWTKSYLDKQTSRLSLLSMNPSVCMRGHEVRTKKN